ncbi:hypothetical protein Hanom_Chr04g00279651 [Helianthus anomalus]
MSSSAGLFLACKIDGVLDVKKAWRSIGVFQAEILPNMFDFKGNRTAGPFVFRSLICLPVFILLARPPTPLLSPLNIATPFFTFS